MLTTTRAADSTIRANYANFGYVPYGQTIMGTMHFFPEYESACTAVSEEEIKIDVKSDMTPFMMARRGDCSFVTKVRNMEDLGVAVAVIIDNRSELISEVLMSDDGTGGGIRIPSMLIGREDGNLLVNWLAKATDEEKEQLVLMCEFVMPEYSNVAVDFWFTSSSDRAIDFLEDFTRIDQSLGDLITF